MPPSMTLSRADLPVSPTTNEALARAAERVEAIVRLAGGVAHDFNNLLTVIGANAHHLEQVLGGNSPHAAEAAEISEAARRAATLTHQLLAFSRQLVLQPRPTDLTDVLDARWHSLVEIGGSRVQLRRTVESSLGTVIVDPHLIGQALTHVVRNAVEAMPHGGVVDLVISNADVDSDFAAQHHPMPRDAYVLIEVRDTGRGMDATTLARALEPFFSTKGTKHGRGMGLPAVYGIVKQSGGFIWLDSAENQGTSCRIYLPRAATPSPMQGLRQPARTVSSGGRETVLVVEDEELVRLLTRRTLERSGYRVFDAPNADAALALVRDHGVQPDLLVTDIVMPGMDGRALASVLSQQLPGLAVVLMSGYFDQRDGGASIAGEPWAFLPKPFTLADLRTAVRDALTLERAL